MTSSSQVIVGGNKDAVENSAMEDSSFQSGTGRGKGKGMTDSEDDHTHTFRHTEPVGSA